MTTKVVKFYPSEQVPSVFAKSGRHPSEPIPLGWISAVLQDINAKFGNEADTCLVHGFDGVTFVGEHTLSAQEIAADYRKTVQEASTAALTALPRVGEPMTKEALESLTALLTALKGS